MGPSDTVLHCAALTFDVSVWEIFVPLSCGATVCVADEATVAAPGRLTALMRQAGVTIVDVMPSLLDALDPARLDGLRIVMTGIEAVPAATVNAWSRDGRPVFNGYGPTEAAVIATLMRCEPGPSDPPIGRPLPNLDAVVVDPGTGEPVTTGQQGELWLAGPQLATRYIGAPAEQEAAFVTRRFPGHDPERWYRTGDLASQDHTGLLSFHGRLDDQIKIRGQRVSPAHVEAVARRYAQVRACAVTVAGGPAARRLVLAVVPRDSERDDSAIRASLLEHLAVALPTHMIPEEVLVLDALPSLPNGKTDRKALAARAAAPASPPAGADPRAVVEALLAEIVGHDGGEVVEPMDSLSAIRTAGRINQRFGADVTAPQVLKAASVSELVALCRQPGEPEA